MTFIHRKAANAAQQQVPLLPAILGRQREQFISWLDAVVR